MIHVHVLKAFYRIMVYVSSIFCQCCLLINYANSSDPDQARQNVESDLDPNSLTLMVFLKDF